MTTKNEAIWRQAVATLASMCTAEQIGRGPTKDAFISTLRTYANEMEKLTKEETEKLAKAAVGEGDE